MITMNMYKKIKNCKDQKVSIRQAARAPGLSRKTVKMDLDAYMKYLTSLKEKTKHFDIYRDEIIEIYNRNEGKLYKSSFISLPGGVL